MQKVLLKTRKPKLNPKPVDSHDDALQQALRFLGYRSRSEAEIRDHLSRRNYSPAVVDRALARLRSLNYASDEKFARGWALSAVQNRGLGPLRIEHELKAKGIGNALRRAVIEDIFSPGRESETAQLLLQKRFKGKNLGESKSLKQAAAFLQRRGYSGAVISQLLGFPDQSDE